MQQRRQKYQPNTTNVWTRVLEVYRGTHALVAATSCWHLPIDCTTNTARKGLLCTRVLYACSYPRTSPNIFLHDETVQGAQHTVAACRICPANLVLIENVLCCMLCLHCCSSTS